MTIYCTYLTVYSGNKLPPFYIGYTKTENIYKGYRGSVCSKSFKNIWYNEIENNPHLFKTYIISLHTTRKEANEREIDFQKKLSILQKPSMYVNRSIGKHKINYGSYNPMYGRNHRKDSIDKQKQTIKKLYESGYINPRKNKKDAKTSERMKKYNPNADGHVRRGAIISKETRNKISKANKGKFAHNTITETFIWKCLNCKKEKVLTAKKFNKKKKFCCQHCYRQYKVYISHEPETQANSFMPSV